MLALARHKSEREVRNGSEGRGYSLREGKGRIDLRHCLNTPQPLILGTTMVPPHESSSSSNNSSVARIVLICSFTDYKLLALLVECNCASNQKHGSFTDWPPTMYGL